MEVPRYIQLDFFMTVLGVLGIIIASYAYLQYYNIFKGNFSLVSGVTVIIILSGLLLSIGMYEMVKNYNRDNELKNLRAKIEKRRLIGKLKNKP